MSNTPKDSEAFEDYSDKNVRAPITSFSGSTFVDGLKQMVDFKKKTLVSDIFNYELG